MREYHGALESTLEQARQHHTAFAVMPCASATAAALASARGCVTGEPSPVAGVGRAEPGPVAGVVRAEPGPGADVGGASPVDISTAGRRGDRPAAAVETAPTGQARRVKPDSSSLDRNHGAEHGASAAVSLRLGSWPSRWIPQAAADPGLEFCAADAPRC